MSEPDDDNTKVIYRDSITGQIVSRQYAEEHPDTTQQDTVPEGSPDAIVADGLGDEDREYEAPGPAPEPEG